MAELQKRIVDYLSRPDTKPLKADSLARKLKLSKRQYGDFYAAVEELVEAGRLREGKRGRLKLRRQKAPAADVTITGIVKRTAKGSAYVVPHEPLPMLGGQDVYVSSRDVGDAHTGDEALVRLLKRRGAGGRRCGRIEEVVERATTKFVGTYIESRGQGYVRVDGKTFVEPIYVGDPGAKGARPDDKVVIEMLRFPSPVLPGEAVLLDVLGSRGDPGVDTLTVIHEFGLPHEFSEEVEAEARDAAAAFDESDLSGRRDLTKETIVTIDPADARDFDDAISLDRLDNGHWHLGVHIADVSHFVRPGTPLDKEARLRGNSVYLPRHVIPMLPEVLSNGVCSLQQGRVRYVKSVFIEFTPEGVPVHTEFANSAIQVTKRFAYEDVLPIVREPEKFKSKVAAKVRKLLGRMHELAMTLRRRRFEHGALNLDLAEVNLEFDDENRVVGAHEDVHDESHQIIEEFMLAANVAVATELADRELAYLRRVHGDPDYEKLQAFAQFVEAVGYDLERPQSRADLQALLDEVRGEPTERAVNFALLRSLKKAEYTGFPMGHYALAVDNYCHFTSPIRRYPDLDVHRLFDRLVRSKKGSVSSPSELELTKLGKHCSLTERRAESAERELVKIKLLELMSERIGEVFEAVITGAENFGVFCQGVELPVEGLVHISALSDNDYFDYERETLSLVGRRSGDVYRLGDRVNVKAVHVDVDRREMDLRIVDRLDDGPRKAREAAAKTSGRKGRGKRREDRSPQEDGKANRGGRSRSKNKGKGKKRGKSRRGGK